MAAQDIAKTGKPVAEVWYAIDAHANGVIRFREDHIDSFAVGDIWLVRGCDRDLVVDTAPYERLVMELRPFLSRRRQPAFPERLPHADMAAAHRLSKCIECNVCTAAVAVKDIDAAGVNWWGWSGPAALVRFARFVLDPRDESERVELARRAGLARFPDFPSLEGVCPQGIDIARDALAPARRALFGDDSRPPPAAPMRRVFVIARGFSAFLNLEEARRRDMEASGALTPLSIEGIDLARRLTL